MRLIKNPRAHKDTASPETVLTLTEEREKQYLPFLQNGWVIFMSGKSLVIGPFDMKTVILPFSFSPESKLCQFFDCIQNKSLIGTTKIHPTGRISLTIKNISAEPQHVTGRMRLTCTQTKFLFIQLLNNEIVELTNKSKCNIISIIDQKEGYKDTLIRMFPHVFEQKVQKINPQLFELRVTHDDICWNQPPISCWKHNYATDIPDDDIRKTIQQMLDEEIIRPLEPKEAVHAIIAPLNFLRKPNGKIRPTIDFRDVNTYIKGTQLGSIESVSDILCKINPDWRFYNVVDIVHGYGSIPIDNALARYFAFHFCGRTYGFKRLPQGVNISPELFNNRMTHILNGLTVIRYFDDILIGGKTEKELFQNTCSLLERFQEYGLTINLSKCDWFETSVEFLGTELNDGNMNPTHKLKAILKKLPQITSRNDIQKALGLCQQVALYCNKYSAIIHELTPFLKRGIHDYQEANTIFHKTVMELCSNTYVLSLNKTGPFFLYTDWAGNPLNQFGYVLCNHNREPILFGSTSSNDKTSSFLGELQGIVFALKQVYKLLKGTFIYVYSDNKATVEWLKAPTFLNKGKDLRIQRLHSWISWHFNNDTIQFCFIDGNKNIIADLLSRWKREHPITTKVEHKAQGYKPEVNQVIQQPTKEEKAIRMREAHAAHFGQKKTLLNLHEAGYTWEGDWKDVKEFVQMCPACQHFQQRKRAVDLGMIDAPCVNHTVCMDFIGPLQRGRHGHRYICTIIDAFSKYGDASSHVRNDTNAAIRLLQRWIEKQGVPHRILSDRGSAFISKEFKKVCHENNIDIIHTPPYSHKSAGTVEKYNQSLIGRLRRIWYARRGDWTDVLDECVTEINKSIHLTTLFSPVYLMTGVHKNGTVASMENITHDRKLAYQRIIRSHTRSNQQKRNKIHKDPLHEGQQVLWFDSQLD